MQRNKHNVITQRDDVKIQVQSSHANCDGDDAQMRHKCKT